MLALTTLTFDQIPLLTDEECDALYAWLWILTEADGWHGCTMDAYLQMGQDARGEWHAMLDAGVLPPGAIVPVCHPDCPASVLEGLPALVERFTGVTELEIVMVRSTHPRDQWRVWIQPPFDRHELAARAERLRDFAALSVRPRHLPHACLCAAFAACVVLGRKG